jgi:hypothetical protein
VRSTAFWIVVAIVALVANYSVTQRVTLHRGALVAATTSALYVCGLYLVYLGTPADLNWHLATTASRTMLTACMALVVSMFFLLSGLEVNRDQVQEAPAP